MHSLLIKYIPVYVGSMFKFIIGPTLGLSIGLSIAETATLTVLGMMSSVTIFSYLGQNFKKKLLKAYFPERKVFSKQNRRIVKFSQSMGLFGISFFTPILFSPILGTLISISLGGRPSKTIAFMLISAIFWSITIAYCCKYIIEY